MKPIDVYLPTKLIFGCGSFNRLATETRVHGTKAMLVTTGIPGTNTVERAMAMLQAGGMSPVLFEKISPNPKDVEINEGACVFKECGCDVIVALGGGSAIDAAKAIGIVAKNGGRINDYLPVATAKIKNVTESYPVITVTTTAGTGSEVTMICVVSLTEIGCKPGFAYPCMYAKTAIVDPELTLTMPPRGTAMVGIDVFFHGMEQYLSRNAHEFIDIYSYNAMKWVVEYLPRLLENLSDIEARSRLHLAATMGGYDITLGATSTLHCIGQAVSGLLDTPHGYALSMFASSFLDNTWQGWIERYAAVAHLLDPALCTKNDKEAASLSGAAMKAFIASIGMPTNAKELKLTEDQIVKISKDVFTWTPRGAAQTIIPMTEELVIKIIRDALK